MIALFVCLKYCYFLCQYRLLSWIFQIWTFMPQLRELHWKTMLVSIPHQKFCFYHLPTRGRAGIKLGDAWYVSNVSIIFDCSMLLYYPFWMFMGFILHIYIIFGTNLLTGGPTRIAVFCLFQYFEEKEHQMESKRNETFRSMIFGTNVIHRTWSASQEAIEAARR